MAFPTENEARSGPPSERRLSPLSVVLVVVFLWVLVALLMPPLPGRPLKARQKAARAQLAAFARALEMFRAENGSFPLGTNGLNDLVLSPKGATNWRQSLDRIPWDPWGHPYHYVFPGQHNTNSYDLSSAAPDGIPGTPDDITNW